MKNNVEEIKREDFFHPRRQDEYGTSVISLQFMQDGTNTLSIKNRYNDKVLNANATFSNNLDNIVDGLSDSFAKYYGLKQTTKKVDLELQGYVKANNNIYYKYNYKINDVYYCIGNVIINGAKLHNYAREKYLVFDYFILDLVHKKINSLVKDPFVERLNYLLKTDNIRLTITNKNDSKIVEINNQDKQVMIWLNKFNCMVKYCDNLEIDLKNDFLLYDNYLEEITLDSVHNIGDNCLVYAKNLQKLNLATVKNIGNRFAVYSQVKELDLAHVKKIGTYFMYFNSHLEKVNLGSKLEIGPSFAQYSEKVKIRTLHK